MIDEPGNICRGGLSAWIAGVGEVPDLESKKSRKRKQEPVWHTANSSRLETKRDHAPAGPCGITACVFGTARRWSSLTRVAWRGMT